MDLNLGHRNLNLFYHFGDSAENEHNTTRAFVIAASRSPWSPMLLRGFFDLLLQRVRQCPQEFAAAVEKVLTAWPESVDFSLERGITADRFPGPAVKTAIIVELTPVAGPRPDDPTGAEVSPRGRVDAAIIVRNADDVGLGIVIESKIYARAASDQLSQYPAALEAKGIKTLLIPITWEAIYSITEALPDTAEHDPIMADFRSFLARDPRLTGFIGFRTEDFSDTNERLDDKLQRFCDRMLAGAVNDPVLANTTLERKKGGLDYDILLPQQSSLVGNIGLATWEDKSGLYAKLVTGWRSRWQTDRVLSPE